MASKLNIPKYPYIVICMTANGSYDANSMAHFEDKTAAMKCAETFAEEGHETVLFVAETSFKRTILVERAWERSTT